MATTSRISRRGNDSAATALAEPDQPDAHRALAEDVRWFAGSPLAAAFGRLALDQVAHREIAAAVDRSGRFADNFTDRGIRSAAFTALAAFGDSSDVEASRADLKRLHRDVRGTGKGRSATPATAPWTPSCGPGWRSAASTCCTRLTCGCAGAG